MQGTNNNSDLLTLSQKEGDYKFRIYILLLSLENDLKTKLKDPTSYKMKETYLFDMYSELENIKIKFGMDHTLNIRLDKIYTAKAILFFIMDERDEAKSFFLKAAKSSLKHGHNEDIREPYDLVYKNLGIDNEIKDMRQDGDGDDVVTASSNLSGNRNTKEIHETNFKKVYRLKFLALLCMTCIPIFVAGLFGFNIIGIIIKGVSAAWAIITIINISGNPNWQSLFPPLLVTNFLIFILINFRLEGIASYIVIFIIAITISMAPGTAATMMHKND